MKRFNVKFLIILVLLFGSIFLFPKITNALDYNFNFQFQVDGNNQVSGIDMSSGVTVSGTTTDVLENSVSRGYTWNILLTRYKGFIVGVMGLISLVLMGFAMYAFVNISASDDNPQKRKDAINHFLMIVIAAAIMGAGTMIFAYALNVF